MALLDPHHRRRTDLNLRGQLLAAHPQHGALMGDQDAVDAAAVTAGLASRSESAHHGSDLGPIRRCPLRRPIARLALQCWRALRLAQGSRSPNSLPWSSL